MRCGPCGAPVRLIHGRRVPVLRGSGTRGTSIGCTWPVCRSNAQAHRAESPKVRGASGKKMTIFGSSNWTGPSSNSQDRHNFFTNEEMVLRLVLSVSLSASGIHRRRTFRLFPLGPEEPVYQLPANNATGQPTTITLRWEGGRWAHKYDIYFGTSSNPPLLVENASTDQSGAVPGQPRLNTGSVDDGIVETFNLPITLQPGTTYFWRIVGKTMANISANGPTWSFTTSGTAPIRLRRLHQRLHRPQHPRQPQRRVLARVAE